MKYNFKLKKEAVLKFIAFKFQTEIQILGPIKNDLDENWQMFFKSKVQGEYNHV